MSNFKIAILSIILSSISISAFSASNVLTASGIGLGDATQAVEKKAEKEGKKVIKVIAASGENITRVSAIVE